MSNSISNISGDNIPNILYHYCGVKEFHGIFSSKQFWLSNATFMNDYMEHRWLIEKARKRIQELSKTSSHAEHYKRLFKYLDDDNVPYIFCFSSKGDMLSQWRAYSGDGAGFAIGFTFKYISEQVDKLKGNRYSIGLYEVEYDENKQLEFIDKSVEFYIDNLSKTKPDELKTEAIEAALHICNSATVCKNPGFIEEGEWRIVLFPSVTGWIPGGEVIKWPIFYDLGSSDICFRVSANRIIPFFKFTFTPDAITEIYLGPKNYAREKDYSLRMFLQNQDFNPESIKIINSAATYR